MTTHKKNKGFTLLELLAVLLVIAALVLAAIPIYQDFVTKARFQEVINVAESLKLPVAACVQDNAAVSTLCVGGYADGLLNIPTDVAITATSTAPAGSYNYVQGYTVSDGVVTVGAITGGGLAGQTIILTPVLEDNNAISWQKTGSCATDGLC